MWSFHNAGTETRLAASEAVRRRVDASAAAFHAAVRPSARRCSCDVTRASRSAAPWRCRRCTCARVKG